jgi:hypothetical protein
LLWLLLLMCCAAGLWCRLSCQNPDLIMPVCQPEGRVITSRVEEVCGDGKTSSLEGLPRKPGNKAAAAAAAAAKQEIKGSADLACVSSVLAWHKA